MRHVFIYGWLVGASVAAGADVPTDSTVNGETITVTASRLHQQMDAPQTMHVIKPDEWEGTGKSIADVVAEQTGIQTRRYGGTGSFQSVSLRGVQGSEVLVLLDGIPLNSAMGGAVDLSGIDPSRIGSIEVYKGQTPARFGGNSIGGVINIVSKSATGSEGVTATAAAGAYGYLNGAVRFNTTPRPGRMVHGMLSYTRSDNDWPYLDRNNTPYNPDDDREAHVENHQYGGVQLRVQPKVVLSPTAVLSTALAWSSSSQGIPATEGYVNQTARYDRTLLDASTRLHWYGLAESRHLTLTPELGYTLQDELNFWTSLDQAMGMSHGSISTQPDSYGKDAFTLHTVHASCLADWQPVPGLGLEASLSARHSDAASVTRVTGFPFGDLPSRRQELTLAADLQTKKQIGTVTLGLLAGGSAAAVRSATDGGENEVFEKPVPASDTVEMVWAAKGGITADVNGRLVLFANAGRYSDLPDLREKYGSRGAVAPNPYLKEETGVQVEAGIRLPFKVHYLETVGFRVERDNSIMMLSDGSMSIPVNLGGALIYGLETTYLGTYTRWLGLEIRMTLQQALSRFRVNNWYGNRLPNEPDASILAKIKTGPWHHISLHYWADWKSAFYRDYGNTDGFRVPEDSEKNGLLLHNLLLRWQPVLTFSCSLSARNIAADGFRYDEMLNPVEGGYSWILYPENEWCLTAEYSF